MRIGARTLIVGKVDSADFSLFSIGSNCVISNSQQQQHTYEERLLRIGPCVVGDGVNSASQPWSARLIQPRVARAIL